MNMASKQKISASLGNLLEWYDFSLYGYFADKLGEIFFPLFGQYGLLASFGVFAVGFLSRPLGAALFGAIGDRYGRKPVLIVVFPMMFLATASIGLLPTYDEAGWIAPFLLLMVRIFQGMSVGGQYTSSITYLAEFTDTNHKKASALSYPWIFSNVGFIFASVVCYVYLAFVINNVSAFWQWRLPFLTSLIGFCFMFWQSTCLTETPSFLKLHQQNDTIKQLNPFQSIFCFPRAFVCCVGLTAAMFVSYYILFVFLITYLPNHLELSKQNAIIINGVALIAQTLAIPYASKLSDQYGHKCIFYVTSIMLAVLIYPGFILFGLHDFWISLSVLIILGVVCSGFCTSISVIMVEAFPAKYRLSGTSISYNTTAALFGGTAPMISTYLVTYINDVNAPAYYIIFWSLIGMLGMYWIKTEPCRVI